MARFRDAKKLTNMPPFAGLLLLLVLVSQPIGAAEPAANTESTGTATPATAAATKTTDTLNPAPNYLPASEIQHITIDAKPYLLLVRPWEGKKKLGSTIILPATNGTADSPGLMAYVRRNINPAGWASLSLTPPRDLPAANFATTAKDVTSPGTSQLTSPANKASPKLPDAQNSQHQQAQENFLLQSIAQLDTVGTDYPGKRVLITADKSAGLLIKLLSENKLAMPDVLVVINPYREEEVLNLALAEQLAKLTIPILDIQSPDGHPASLETADARQRLAVSLDSPNYRQTRLLLNLDNESAWQNCLVSIKGFAARMSGAQ